MQDAALKKEKKEQERLQKQMQKQRADQLKRANYEEDKAIKRLEKQLKLNKRKTKSLPKTFAADGLDCQWIIIIVLFYIVIVLFLRSIRSL